MLSFSERFTALASARSPLCLGLDPSAEVFAQWGLASDAAGLQRFCGTVLDAVGDSLAVVKPQAAFFERFGPAGMTQLAQAAAQLRSRNVLSLIDAKRGDVGGTMQGYASAMLGPDSGFGGDAATVTAYLGFEALQPMFDRAQRPERRCSSWSTRQTPKGAPCSRRGWRTAGPSRRPWRTPRRRRTPRPPALSAR